LVVVEVDKYSGLIIFTKLQRRLIKKQMTFLRKKKKIYKNIIKK